MSIAGRGLFYLGVGLAPLLMLRGALNLLASDVVLLASAALLLFARVEGRREWSVVRIVAGFAILAGTLLSAIRADNPAEDFKIGLETLYVVTVLPWQARKALRTRQHLRTAVMWWLAGASLCAAGALAQSLISPTIIPGGSSSYGRSSGFAGSASDLGGILASAVPLAVVLLARVRRRGGRAVLLLGVAIYAIALVLAGSAAAFIAIALALGYAVARGVLTVRTLLVYVAVGSTAVAFSAALNPTAALSPVERFYIVSGLEATTGQANTLSARLQTDQLGIQGIIASPLVGRGLDEQSSLVVNSLAVHNTLLGAWYQGGALVFVGLVLALGAALRAVPRARTPHFWLREALVVGFVGGLAFTMSAPQWYTRYFWLQVALVIAAAEVQCRMPDEAVGRL
jgi:O-antigen ligase